MDIITFFYHITYAVWELYFFHGIEKTEELSHNIEQYQLSRSKSQSSGRSVILQIILFSKILK